MRIILPLLLMAFTSISNAQNTSNNNSFIEVPDRFEFVSGDNTYQLSDMMVYYFEKKGMKAYRKKNSPNAPKCDALYADIQKGKGLLFTKLSVVIKDCDGVEIFKSEYGRSKFKEYSKAYQDALRMAFKTFSKENITIPELINNSVTEQKSPNPLVKKVITKDDAIEKNTLIVKVNKEEIKAVQIPQLSFSNYLQNEKSYLLKKVTTGYTLFLTQEGNDNFIKVGDIVLTGRTQFDMVDIYGETKKGYFNTQQDIVIQLASGKEIIYKKQL